MILYTNGCSMTEGAELEEPKKYSWPTCLANSLNRQVVNQGCSGGSNERILRTSISWLSKYLNNKKDPMNLFVVIGWTSFSRVEYIVNGNWFNFLPKQPPLPKHIQPIQDFYAKYIIDELRDNTYSILNILSMQSWLKVNNISYLFFDALHGSYNKKYEDVQQMMDQVDVKRYYTFDNHYYCMWSFCDNYARGLEGHPLEKGHQAWADLLENYIIENNLLELT